MPNDLKVAEARARFGELLDEAEQGRPVFIERRGVRFRLAAEPAEAPKAVKAPITLLEVQFLAEIGSLRMSPGRSAASLADDERWRVDEPPALKWIAAACPLDWTRDPFDRLLVAHARVRGWRLATADEVLLERLAATEVLPL